MSEEPQKTIRVVNNLEDSKALVLCRLETGEEVYVPLKTLVSALLPEIVSRIRYSVGARY